MGVLDTKIFLQVLDNTYIYIYIYSAIVQIKSLDSKDFSKFTRGSKVDQVLYQATCSMVPKNVSLIFVVPC